MAKNTSAKKEKAKGFVGGKALYQQRAAQALPILVRQARVHQPVFYRKPCNREGLVPLFHEERFDPKGPYRLIKLDRQFFTDIFVDATATIVEALNPGLSPLLHYLFQLPRNWMPPLIFL